MGDRRVADRRAPEQGVVKIKLKNLIFYCIIGVIIAASVIGNVVLGILYSKAKKENEQLLTEKEVLHDFYYEDYDVNEYENSIEDSQNIVEESENQEIETSETTDENTCELVLLGETNKIKRGESATYELKATDINAGNGIIMFETLLECDEDSMEYTIETGDEIQWDKTSIMDNYLTMTRKDLLPSSQDQTIAKVTITAKKNANIGEQTIELKNIKFTTDDDSNFNLQDKKLVINIE